MRRPDGVHDFILHPWPAGQKNLMFTGQLCELTQLRKVRWAQKLVVPIMARWVHTSTG